MSIFGHSVLNFQEMDYEFKTLVRWDTELCADSVEWCPFDTFQHIFVCGTYQLKESENELIGEDDQSQHSPLRHGRLYLMNLVNCDKIINRLQTLEVSAVLDCKWAPQLILNQILLAVAGANGQMSIYKLNEDESTICKLEYVTRVDLPKQENEVDLLTLSLNWSIGQCGVKIATSDSKGRISVFQLDGTDLHLLHSWTAHTYEAWIVNFNPFHSHICYTGGDDCKLRMYDLRCELTSAQLTKSTHLSGVTSLVCPLKTENLLFSGSYDEQVLLWDTRQMKRPLNSVSVGGGVWRIRFKPHSEDLILVACMYNGFYLLDQNLQVLSKYTEEHQSICYGADWSYLSAGSNSHDFSHFSGKNSSVVATCSFYDRKLCVSLVSNLCE